jgi:hypothetical protein
MIFNHWGIQNFLTRGDRQTVGCEIVNTQLRGEETSAGFTCLDDELGRPYELAP